MTNPLTGLLSACERVGIANPIWVYTQLPIGVTPRIDGDDVLSIGYNRPAGRRDCSGAAVVADELNIPPPLAHDIAVAAAKRGLLARGYRHYECTTNDLAGRTLYRVAIGTTPDSSDAIEAEAFSEIEGLTMAILQIPTEVKDA